MERIQAIFRRSPRRLPLKRCDREHLRKVGGSLSPARPFIPTHPDFARRVPEV